MMNFSWKNAVIVLTVLTGVIHLALLNPLMILNGLGYLALLAALYFLPQTAAQRPTIRYVLMGYTAVTIVGYFVLQGAGAFSNYLGLVDKVIEVGLLVALWQDSKN
jgi:hypothetical protein